MQVRVTFDSARKALLTSNMGSFSNSIGCEGSRQFFLVTLPVQQADITLPCDAAGEPGEGAACSMQHAAWPLHLLLQLRSDQVPHSVKAPGKCKGNMLLAPALLLACTSYCHISRSHQHCSLYGIATAPKQSFPVIAYTCGGLR